MSSPAGAAGLTVQGAASRPLGLLAGGGGLPGAVARAARRQGKRVLAAGFPDLTEPGLEADVDSLSWHPLGAVSSLLSEWREAGVRDAVMAGKVPKTLLVRDAHRLSLDDVARDAIEALADRRDDSILLAVVRLLETHGITLRAQAELVPELLVEEGVLGAVSPTAAQRADVGFGWPIAKAISGLDLGQSVVVRGRAVVAVEAIEGTDATIVRGAELGGPGCSVVKVAKPEQDPRFDLPAVGLETLRVLAEGRAGLLAVEAGRTLLLDRQEALRFADRHGIALVGIAPDGPVS